MANSEEFGQAYARNQIKRHGSPIRRLIKSFYIERILDHIDGPAVDLGCGAGQILERLPSGSIGVEVNPFLVTELRQRGLDVVPAAESISGFNLSNLQPNRYKALVLSHVLEHFHQADEVLRGLLRECARLGISTVVLVVPGLVGFRSDPTHKTFVDMTYLQANNLIRCEGFRLEHHSYFPGNARFLGRFFIYNELMLVFRAVRVDQE